ncbi:MAG: dockerin type I domain-containing protein [Patescibacteria group bacterium]
MNYGVLIRGCLIGLLTLLVVNSSVLAVSSTNFEVDADNNTTSQFHRVTGTTFLIDGQIDPLAGKVSSSNFTVESGGGAPFYCGDGFVDPGEGCDKGNYGSNLNGLSCTIMGLGVGTLTCSTTCVVVTSSCAGGGGRGSGGGIGLTTSAPNLPEESEFTQLVISAGGTGNQLIAVAPDFSSNGTTGVKPFTFSSSLLIYGARDPGFTISANGNLGDVVYTTETSWMIRVDLFGGVNSLTITPIDALGNSLDDYQIPLEIIRRIPGDFNGSGSVDEYDISGLSRNWGTSARAGDFNEDGVIDEYDFSILISRWNSKA